jgi:hypothetical protein
MRKEVVVMHARKGVAEGAAVGAAAVAVAVTYGIYAVHPWQGSTPLNQFLAAFGRADTTAWPMQIVWYLAAVAMVGLALRPVRRSSQLICVLAAAAYPCRVMPACGGTVPTPCGRFSIVLRLGTGQSGCHARGRLGVTDCLLSGIV